MSKPLPLRPASPKDEGTETFGLFNEFPTELRLRIWEMALPSRRVVPINFSATRRDITPCPPLALLQVCRESRNVVQQIYSRFFTSSDSPSGIYIRPDIDIIQLPLPCAIHSVRNQRPDCIHCSPFGYEQNLRRYSSIESVQNVAIASDCTVGRLHHIWKTFPRMQKAFILLDYDWYDYIRLREIVERNFKTLFRASKEIHQEDLSDFEIPTVIPIRRPEIDCLNSDAESTWADPFRPLPEYVEEEYEEDWDSERSTTWGSTVWNAFRILQPDERALLLNSFDRLPFEERKLHLEIIHDWSDVDSKKYLRRSFNAEKRLT